MYSTNELEFLRGLKILGITLSIGGLPLIMRPSPVENPQRMLGHILTARLWLTQKEIRFKF